MLAQRGPQKLLGGRGRRGGGADQTRVQHVPAAVRLQPSATLGGDRWLQVPARTRVMVVESAQTPAGSMLRCLRAGERAGGRFPRA